MIDPTGKTEAELRTLAETLSQQAHSRIVDALDPIIGLALIVMELDRLAAQAGPSAPWWSALKAGEKIKIARAGVEVYYSDRVMVWRTVGLTWPVMVVAQPAQGEPVQDDFVCVNNRTPPGELWVRGQDCRAA